MLYIKNGFLKIKDIPVMYLPYYSHPTSNKRRSGFLNPNFVQNQRSGLYHIILILRLIMTFYYKLLYGLREE